MAYKLIIRYPVKALAIFWIVFSLTACTGNADTTLPVPLSERIEVGEKYMSIRLRGTLRLATREVDGLAPRGLSGLTWDKETQLLYAVSDRGNLFHLRPRFNHGLLTDVQFVAAYPLRDATGAPLKPPYTDAEGLTRVAGAEGHLEPNQLVVSFEGKVRVIRYSPTGKWLGEESLPVKLRDIDNYASPNKALEAVTRYGNESELLLAPERPLRGDPPDEVPIFAGQGRFWRYPLFKTPNSSVVAMETLADGSLLVLERAFVAEQQQLTITLRRTALTPPPQTELMVETLAVLDSSQQWQLDNFEGLAHHFDTYFFMVSDDNFSASQATLLVYFELLRATD